MFAFNWACEITVDFCPYQEQTFKNFPLVREFMSTSTSYHRDTRETFAWEVLSLEKGKDVQTAEFCMVSAKFYMSGRFPCQLVLPFLSLTDPCFLPFSMLWFICALDHRPVCPFPHRTHFPSDMSACGKGGGLEIGKRAGLGFTFASHTVSLMETVSPQLLSHCHLAY